MPQAIVVGGGFPGAEYDDIKKNVEGVMAGGAGMAWFRTDRSKIGGGGPPRAEDLLVRVKGALRSWQERECEAGVECFF